MRIADASKSDGYFESTRPRRPIYTPDSAGIWADIPAFTAFADEVADALDGRDLRYSQRLRLLKRADHFGIRRFDANLVIAMVQHRMGEVYIPPPEPHRQTSGLLATIAIVAVIQSGILAAGYWLLS